MLSANLKPKRRAASSRGFAATARLSCTVVDTKKWHAEQANRPHHEKIPAMRDVHSQREHALAKAANTNEQRWKWEARYYTSRCGSSTFRGKQVAKSAPFCQVKMLTVPASNVLECRQLIRRENISIVYGHVGLCTFCRLFALDIFVNAVLGILAKVVFSVSTCVDVQQQL